MGMPVVIVATGGMPVVDVTPIASMTPIKYGLPVTEAANGYGVAVTLVTDKSGLPVVFETIGAGAAFASLDLATARNATLSGDNLVATNTGTTSIDQGVRVASSLGRTAGKYYFEVTMSVAATGINRAVGIGTTSSTISGMGLSSLAVVGTMLGINGNICSNGVGALGSIGVVTAGQVMGVAADLDNRKIWFRRGATGNWNGNVSNNPTTNVGGIVVPAGTMVPFQTFGGVSGTAGTIFISNFGASAFSGAVPSGFTAGWPA